MLKYLPIAAVACGLFSLGNQASAFDLKSWIRGDPKEKVEVTVTYDEECPLDEPLRFKIYNGSDETISRTEFSLAGRWPGRSSAVVHTPGGRSYMDDRILSPGRYASYCKSPLAMYGVYDFEEGPTLNRSYTGMRYLEWEATVEEVYTQ